MGGLETYLLSASETFNMKDIKAVALLATHYLYVVQQQGRLLDNSYKTASQERSIGKDHILNLDPSIAHLSWGITQGITFDLLLLTSA